MISEKLNIAVNICDIGAVIGLHVGPGAIGIVYYTEKDIREI
jgi:fatty acid-binding protein DegV